MIRCLYILVLLSISIVGYSQIGVNTITPNSNTHFHISERSTPSAAVESKGIIIPRLTETERNLIVPTSDENSLLIFNTTENCYNYWDKNDGATTAVDGWKSLCGNEGNANFNFPCTDNNNTNNIEVYGKYIENKNLDSSNYIIINNINVTKKGAYLITVQSTPGNGYSFVGQGVFTHTGLQSVRLVGQGKPIAIQTDSFGYKSTGSTTQTICTTSITVEPSISNYEIECSSVVVNGVNKKGTAFTGSNTINLRLRVNTLGSYNIYTELTNGIKYEATGMFTSTGTQYVTLVGSGTPVVTSDFDIQIKTNTPVNTITCSTRILITLPALTYGIIGDNDTYSWGGPIRKKALDNKANFGPNGIIKIENFSQQFLIDANNTTNITSIINILSSVNKPAIVLYNAYSSAPTANLITALNTYVNGGGVLIFGSRDNYPSDVNAILLGIFGTGTNTAANQTGSGDDYPYAINNLPNDPIINGPFGNTIGYYWGEDNATIYSIVVQSLPPNSIQIASAYTDGQHSAVPTSYSMVWYNDTKNFFYFGDSVGSANSNSSGAYPAYYSTAGKPQLKIYGTGNEVEQIVNSTLELNAVAWGLKKAAAQLP